MNPKATNPDPKIAGRSGRGSCRRGQPAALRIRAKGRARRQASGSDQRGFTLIELLVVIVILGLLVGLVGPRLIGSVGQSKPKIAKAQIELFGAALDQYKLDVGVYPTAGHGLEALVRNPGVTTWSGPYLKKSAVPRDPWGNLYKYGCCPGLHGDYDLWSEGADNAPGGEGESGDVTSWDTK